MRAVFLVIIVMLAFGGRVQALDLTVEQCVAMGLNNNPTLEAQQALIESAVQEMRIARSAFLPTLEAQGTYAALDQPERIIIEKDLFGAGFPSEDTEIRDESDVYGAGLTLRQTLYAGGRITHAYQRDTDLLASARHEFGDRQSQLTYDLKKAFYEILIHQSYSDSYSQQVVARQESLRVTMALAEEGQISVNKLELARAKLLFTEAEQLETQQRMANSLDQLRRLLALDNREKINLVDTSSYPIIKNSLPDLSVIAMENRDDLKQLEARIKAAGENLHIAKSRFQPEIFAQGGYIRQRETNLTRADNWGASINFNWSLFEGGKTTAETAKAKAEQQHLISLRRDLTAMIDNEVRAAQRRVQQKQLLVKAYEVNLQAEERIYRDILIRSEEGDVLAFEQAEQKAALLMAQANYLESINQLRISIAALETALAAPVDNLLDVKDIYQPLHSSNWSSPQQSKTATDVSADLPVLLAAKKLPTMVDTPLGLTSKNHNYVVQLGAFKNKERALDYMNSMKKQYPDKKFETISVKGFHKVRSTLLESHTAAVSTLAAFKGQGIIVRANTNH